MKIERKIISGRVIFNAFGGDPAYQSLSFFGNMLIYLGFKSASMHMLGKWTLKKSLHSQGFIQIFLKSMQLSS